MGLWRILEMSLNDVESCFGSKYKLYTQGLCDFGQVT